jgi:hypothetical protein
MRSRQVRVAGVAQTSRACFGPAAVRSPGVQASLSIDCQQEPARAALTIELASPARCPVLSPRRHGLRSFGPSVGSAREGRKREPPERSIRWGRDHRAGGVTPVKYGTGPAVKTSNPRLAPRGAGRAVGGIRAWAENPGRRASSCSILLLSRASVCADVKAVLRELSDSSTGRSPRPRAPIRG